MGLSAQQLSQPLRLGHLRGDSRRLLRCLERPHGKIQRHHLNRNQKMDTGHDLRRLVLGEAKCARPLNACAPRSMDGQPAGKSMAGESALLVPTQFDIDINLNEFPSGRTDLGYECLEFRTVPFVGWTEISRKAS